MPVLPTFFTSFESQAREPGRKRPMLRLVMSTKRSMCSVTRSWVLKLGLVAIVCSTALTLTWLTCSRPQIIVDVLSESREKHVPSVLYVEVNAPVCSKCAVVITPYHLTPGGGENYLLRSVVLLQKMGYVVDLMVFEHNFCQDMSCVLRTASFLRVPLDVDKLNFIVARPEEHRLPVRAKSYEVSFLLGNEKIPQFVNPATFGIYMCQFPFDLDRAFQFDDVQRFGGFQAVWLNSEYTLGWYNHFMLPVLTSVELAASRTLWPSVNVMYPPVEPYNLDQNLPAEAKRSGVLMIGRFFGGRQSKGHNIALEVFKELVETKKIPPDTILTLAGALATNQEPWLDYLRRLASNYGILDRVRFMVDVPAHELRVVMNKASVLWHMTGVNVSEHDDPASIEHFGMSVVEAMSAGVIPIVMKIGGTREIVDNTCGRLVRFPKQFAAATSQILTLPADQREAMRNAAVERSKKFSTTSFVDQGKKLIERGLLELKFRKYAHLIPMQLNDQEHQQRARHLKWNWSSGQKYAAMIFEYRPHFALELVCKNVMTKLGPDWSLHVFHSDGNKEFVQHALRGFSRSSVYLHEITEKVISVATYNRLMTSHLIWEPLQQYSHVLTFQTDSFLLHPLKDEFLKYAYVGAPWCKDNRIADDLYAKGEIKDLVGNGGFSLRSPAEMLNCIDRHPEYNPYTENEDVFFVRCLTKAGEPIAPAEVAASFAVEVPCNGTENLGKNVAGVHAAWYYMSDEAYKQLLIEASSSAVMKKR